MDERPAQMPISLLVVHNISLPPGQFGGGYIEALFCNRLDPEGHPYFREIHHLRVSAHLLIDRAGRITQFVPFDRRAWHAGVSNYRGVERCNDFAVGVELEGVDDLPYTDKQYDTLAAVARTLIAEYPQLDTQRIVGHSDIAPGRKTDPGSAFDWLRLRALLRR